MCRLLEASTSGYYEWRFRPLSNRAIEDQRLLPLIRASYAASHGVYGYRRVHLDLLELGETCGKYRVVRIMKSHDIQAVHEYKKPRIIHGRPSILAPNTLQREFTVSQPETAWVTDITYIRTWQGSLYLAVVVDLYSRKVIGWSMEAHTGPGHCSGRPHDGPMATKTPATGSRSFRPGLPVWQR
jgi:putative transposase